MSDPQTLAQSHSTEVWAALIASLSGIGILITVLWNRQNADIKDHANKLEAGQLAFTEIGHKLVLIGEQIKNLQEEDLFDGVELGRLETEIRLLTARILIIETEHKNCVLARRANP